MTFRPGFRTALAAGLLIPFPATAWAQAADAAPPPAGPTGDAPATDVEGNPVVVGEGGTDPNGTIVVVATRIKGQVQTSQPPVVTLNEEDIAAYGAASIGDLLGALAPQTGTGRGRGSGGPVVLLNGLRISGFRELRGLPPEAIRRVEVLPEEVALEYGYRPDQRVVNIILKDHYASIGSQTEVTLPTGGGYSGVNEEATLARIDQGARLNVTGTLSARSPLTEAERGIVQPAAAGATVAGDPSPADYRTLLARTLSTALNATLARPLGGGAALTLNGLVQYDDSRSLSGLNGTILTDPAGDVVSRTTLLPGPLAQVSRVTTISAGAALNKPLGDWQLSVTADGSHVATTRINDRRADLSQIQALVDSGALGVSDALPASAIVGAPADRATSKVDSLTSLATINGRPVRLPGGEAALTVKAGFAYSGISSDGTLAAAGPTRLRRGDAQVGFSLDLPITSRRENFGAGVGDLSLNLNAEAHRVSDFGGLFTYGAGLTWKPTTKLALTATYIATDKAPGLSDLGAPVTVTPGVALYDFARGETVLATVTSGGNPSLRKEQQRDVKLAANWILPFMENGSLLVEYFRNHSSDTTNAFPLLTPAIEAAFPGRVVRDASGRIVSVDQSPVTFAQERSSRLRFGVNIGGSFGKPDPNARRGGGMGGMGALRGLAGGGGGGFGGGGGPRGGGFGPGGPGGGGRGGFDGRGRWNLSLTHSIELTNTVQIAAGLPVLDLLGGDAVSGSGVARHSLTLEGGGFYRGFGLRLSGTYTGGTHIDGSGLPGSGRLDFAPIAKFSLRAFADLGRKQKLVDAVPFLKGARVSLAVTNLFDAQQRVTDANGAVPLRYQPGFLDPAGRTIRLEFRKQF